MLHARQGYQFIINMVFALFILNLAAQGKQPDWYPYWGILILIASLLNAVDVMMDGELGFFPGLRRYFSAFNTFVFCLTVMLSPFMRKDYIFYDFPAFTTGVIVIWMWGAFTAGVGFVNAMDYNEVQTEGPKVIFEEEIELEHWEMVNGRRQVISREVVVSRRYRR